MNPEFALIRNSEYQSQMLPKVSVTIDSNRRAKSITSRKVLLYGVEENAREALENSLQPRRFGKNLIVMEKTSNISSLPLIETSRERKDNSLIPLSEKRLLTIPVPDSCVSLESEGT